MICFDLLQVAIGVKDGNLLVVSSQQWQEFYTFCKRQALLGIGFVAVEKIGSCPKNLMLSWYAVVMQILRRNLQMNLACREVTEMFAKDGFDTCVLKGQGNLLNYPEHLKDRRQPGDIDLWASPQNGEDAVKAIIEYVRSKGHTEVEPNYLHIDMRWKEGIEVEVHYRPRFLVSPLRNKRILAWFEKQKIACMQNVTEGGFAIPTASVNVVYQMAHLFSHYFDEGLGMRQLLDYYYVLKRWHREELPNDIIMRALRSFGIAKFAAAVMWVLQEVFVLSRDEMICEPNEKEGHKLLSEMMQSGNFGQYDERGKVMKNGGMLMHGIWKLKRIMGLMGSYPEMALVEPWFRVWHYGWRRVHRK